MDTLSYKITDDHLVIQTESQTAWHYIGNLAGITANITEVQNGAPPHSVIIELNLPTGIARYNIRCSNSTSLTRVITTGNNLIAEIIAYTRDGR